MKEVESSKNNDAIAHHASIADYFMIKNYILGLMIIPSLLLGKLIEAESLEEIIKHLSYNSLVFCDLDNTLIMANQHFGSVQWGDHYINKLIETGESPQRAEEYVHHLWMTILPSLPMRLVDPDAPQIIQNIRNSGIQVLGLTARFPYEAPYTHPQLQKFGIQFDHPYSDHEIPVDYPALYEKGILFSGTRNKKSEVLINFLKRFHLFPKKIIFIDDKWSHVKDLESALAPFNIEFVGIRLSKADKHVNEYDPLIAEIQMDLFPNFISDEEALQLLTTKASS